VAGGAEAGRELGGAVATGGSMIVVVDEWYQYPDVAHTISPIAIRARTIATAAIPPPESEVVLTSV
jgi:hypothetical protein